MIGEVIDEPEEQTSLTIIDEKIFNLLVVMHSVSRIDAENISARLCAGPVEVPVIIGGDLNPSTLLKVIQQNRLVHVRTKADLHSLVLIVGNSKCN